MAIKDLVDMSLPPMTSLKVVRSAKAIEEANKDIEEVLKKIQEKYAEVDEETKKTIVKKEKIEDFNKELNELMEGTSKVDIDKIQITENFPEIKPKILLSLDFMFEE